MRRDEFIEGLGRSIEWNEPPFTADTVLRSDPMWDSVAVMSTIMFVDEHLGTTLSAERLQGVERVQDLIELVHERLA